MNAQNELRTLGFVRAGAIRPACSGKSCKADLTVDLQGYAVYALVVGHEIKKFGQTRTGIRKRIGGHASALKGIMEDPTGHPLDPFKRLAPHVIAANQEIEVWARASTAGTYAAEELELNLRYTPAWVGRPN